MRKLILSILGACLFAAIVLAGGDPWKSKPFQQWTESDVKTVFQSSPWARPNLSPLGAWKPLGSRTISGVGVYSGSGSVPSAVADEGASREKDAIAASRVYTVLWWSSRTIRAATTRRAVIHGTMKQEEAENLVSQPRDEYEILVMADNMSIFEKRGEKAFESAATLEMKKSKQKLSPTHVAFQRGADGQTVVGAIFYFPKKDKNGGPTLAPDEKDIEFFLWVGDAKVLAGFDPRKMVDSKGSDL